MSGRWLADDKDSRNNNPRQSAVVYRRASSSVSVHMFSVSSALRKQGNCRMKIFYFRTRPTGLCAIALLHQSVIDRLSVVKR